MRERVENRREERVMRKIEGNKAYQKVAHKKPLYQEIEERYYESVERPQQQ